MSRFSPVALVALCLLTFSLPINGIEERQVHTLALTSKGTDSVYAEMDVSGGVLQIRGIVPKRPMEHFRLLIDGSVAFEGPLREKVYLNTTAHSSIRAEAPPPPAGERGPDVVKILVGRSSE